MYQKPTRNGNSMLLLHGSPLAEKKKYYYAQTTVYMDDKNDGILKKNGLSLLNNFFLEVANSLGKTYDYNFYQATTD